MHFITIRDCEIQMLNGDYCVAIFKFSIQKGWNTMSILEDLQKEISSYAKDHVTLNIVKFDDPNATLNKGEVASFSVRIINKGPLDIKKCNLRIESTDFGSVSINGTDFKNQAIDNVEDPIEAGGAFLSGPYFFKAEKVADKKKKLFCAHLGLHNLSLNSILVDLQGKVKDCHFDTIDAKP